MSRITRTLAALLATAALAAVAAGEGSEELFPTGQDTTGERKDSPGYSDAAPDAPHALTVVADWLPLADPAGGPYFAPLDEDARYYAADYGDGFFVENEDAKVA
jgi:hypothetical protein